MKILKIIKFEWNNDRTKMIVAAYLNKNICQTAQHEKTTDRVLYIGVAVNAGEMEGNGNPNQMPSTVTLSNSGIP